MKNSNSDVSIEHMEEWSLAYLEGWLSPKRNPIREAPRAVLGVRKTN